MTYNSQTGKLSIYNPTTGHFTMQTRAQLLAVGSWGGISFGTEPNDANSVIGFDSNATYVAGTLQCQNMVQLMPFQNVYICSSDFGMPNESPGPNGESHILRKVPVDQSWGNILHSQRGTDVDHIDVSGQQLQALSFSIRDSRGRLVDLQGQHVSFTIQIIAPQEI